MMRLFRTRKSRKYPIQYDDRGQSLRARCFQRFDEGERPIKVARELEMKESTAKRYFQDWKKHGPNFDKQYAFTQGLFKKTAPDRDYNIDLFARAFGIPKEELEAILAKPYGLRQLMTGKLYFPGNADADHKLHVVLVVALCISDYLVKGGGKVEDVLYAFERLMKENQESRRQEDADIKEENREIAFTREVLEAAVQIEKEGRPKRYKLTTDEEKAAIKFGMEVKMEQGIRSFEAQYWIRTGELMAEGLTSEQAREKIYQDLLDNRDLEGARMMRKYQDVIHPLKTKGQKPPPSPSEPTSPA